MASLVWKPVNDPSVVSYTVHYGKRSAANSESCNYENVLEVSEPSAMVTGLESNSIYYFAVSVSTSDGRRGMCSKEVSKRT
jgi:hypothetical protein